MLTQSQIHDLCQQAQINMVDMDLKATIEKEEGLKPCENGVDYLLAAIPVLNCYIPAGTSVRIGAPTSGTAQVLSPSYACLISPPQNPSPVNVVTAELVIGDGSVINITMPPTANVNANLSQIVCTYFVNAINDFGYGWSAELIGSIDYSIKVIAPDSSFAGQEIQLGVIAETLGTCTFEDGHNTWTGTNDDMEYSVTGTLVDGTKGYIQTEEMNCITTEEASQLIENVKVKANIC